MAAIEPDTGFLAVWGLPSEADSEFLSTGELVEGKEIAGVAEVEGLQASILPLQRPPGLSPPPLYRRLSCSRPAHQQGKSSMMTPLGQPAKRSRVVWWCHVHVAPVKESMIKKKSPGAPQGIGALSRSSGVWWEGDAI